MVLVFRSTTQDVSVISPAVEMCLDISLSFISNSDSPTCALTILERHEGKVFAGFLLVDEGLEKSRTEIYLKKCQNKKLNF